MLNLIIKKTLGLVFFLSLFSCEISNNKNVPLQGIIPKPEKTEILKGYFKSTEMLGISYSDPRRLPVLNTFIVQQDYVHKMSYNVVYCPQVIEQYTPYIFIYVVSLCHIKNISE